jgi:hypothetical protein
MTPRWLRRHKEGAHHDHTVNLHEFRMTLVQIGSCDDFARGRCVDPSTDQAANAACQIS